MDFRLRQPKLVFVALLFSILAAPLAADAEKLAKVPRIGSLASSSASDNPHLFQAFRQRLCDLGYVDGQNISIEYRWAHGKIERLPHLAAEFVRLRVDVIVTWGNQAAKKGSTTIPIVMLAEKFLGSVASKSQRYP